MENIPDWLIFTSVWVNERTGGPKGWTLCARFYRNNPKSVAVVVIDAFFVWKYNDAQHCRKSYHFRSSIAKLVEDMYDEKTPF